MAEGKRRAAEKAATVITMLGSEYASEVFKYLKESEVEELRQHVDNSKTSVKINLISSTPMARTAALQFQRSFDSMDDDTAKKIMEIIERNKKSNGL